MAWNANLFKFLYDPVTFGRLKVVIMLAIILEEFIIPFSIPPLPSTLWLNLTICQDYYESHDSLIEARSCLSDYMNAYESSGLML